MSRAVAALLFVGGVMNVAWVAALAVFVLAEKAIARGVWLSRLSGLALIGWAAWVLTTAARQQSRPLAVGGGLLQLLDVLGPVPGQQLQPLAAGHRLAGGALEADDVQVR